jgi:hypothetical protein
MHQPRSERRRFLRGLGGFMMLAAAGGESPPQAAASTASPQKVRWPKPIGSPVLDSLPPVIEHSRDVHTNVEKLVEVAGWMAYEELPMPDYFLPMGVGANNADETIDFIMVADVIDTAFSDFTTHMKFQVDYLGQHWSDSDAEVACLKRAMDQGIPILDGSYLAQLTRPQMEKIFAGNIEIPMLDEKLELWRQAGAVLAAKYHGRFHNFIRTCSPRLYDHGNGMVDRLVVEFPRFNDVSIYDDHEIKLYKLPQLGLWFLYASLHRSGKFQLEDVHSMTAFADYIVPVGLRLMGITSYSPALEKAINTHQLIPRDSTQEIEIRAHCIYATALLTEEINKLRAPEAQIIIPQIDARIWTHYHTTNWPHHLTRTIMY